MERRHTTQPVEVRLAVKDDKDSRSIVGMGAVYYDGSEGTEYHLWGNVYERIMPGAFDRAIREDDVRGLFNHDANMVLGRNRSGTMSLSVNNRGLEYDIDEGDTTIGRDVAEHISRGDVTGSSFSFQVIEEVWRIENPGQDDEREIREIVEVRLFDVGPVTFPAYEATTVDVAEARSAHDAFVENRLRKPDEDAKEPEDDDDPVIDIETYKCRVRAAEVAGRFDEVDSGAATE